jgi:nucleoside-diphosphate-sugar epimerase
MNVTVTGATGSIGLACAQMLVRAGHRVRAFVRRPDDFQRRCTEPRIEVVAGDILDRSAVVAALVEADAVVHCVDFPPSQYALSWEALQHTLEGLGPRKGFIYPGNVWVYGPRETGRAGPDDPKVSPARLGEMKADMEKVVTVEGGTVVRLPDVYGPGVMRGRTANIFQRVLAGQTVYYPGRLDRRAEFLYIADAARALIAPLGRAQARGAEFTAPAHAPITIHDFVSLIAKAAGQSMRLRSIPVSLLRAAALLRPESRRLRGLSYLFECSILLDGSRMRHELGWVPEVDYGEGVRRTIRWLRQLESHTATEAQGR